MSKRCLLFLFLLGLCGCFQVKDELTIAPDGSGKVHLEVASSLPQALTSQLDMAGAMGGQTALYPPASEDQAKQFFPGKDFTVQTRQQRSGQTNTVIIDAAFKDINALLSSPYGKSHQLSVVLSNETLSLRAVSGMEGVARMMQAPDTGSSGFEAFAMAGFTEERQKTNELSFAFRVTLPNASKTAEWSFARAQAKDAEEFCVQMGQVMETSSLATGCKMSPITPPRLALGAFKDLQEQTLGAAQPPPDTNKILAAAHFVPYSLQIERAIDLGGANAAGAGQNIARLSGAIVLPVELAPQKWGTAELGEATDPNGNSLKPDKPDQREAFMMMAAAQSSADNTSSNEVQHPVTLSFRPPDWKTKEIASVTGSIDLEYFGGSQLVKISNAIPAKWIMSGRDGMVFSSDGQKTISDPRLPQLGVSIRLQMGMAQNGVTQLSFRFTSDKSSLMDLQVFDAEGRPWPTMLQQEMGGMNGAAQVMVFGRPKAPLSLALLFSGGGGSSVKVPIAVQHVPTRGE